MFLCQAFTSASHHTFLEGSTRCDKGHDSYLEIQRRFPYLREEGARVQRQKPPKCVGGPGSEAPRHTESSGWVNKATQYFSVVMLDQRGTGRSSPISVDSLERIGSPQSQADYLQHFRSQKLTTKAVFTQPEVWQSFPR